ncbi:DUF5719 family protein [Kitasatospora sp. GP82]|uniref:DUF5719 family protein n=1 Tax=Kitasatospora sp. GP82 TaxID=3035089 RepID=UPI002476B077|nr:DUF5719 family protein [Kitasatospora sp. GP82]MDH6124076.1 hypothetical protein [Kitasatospora sp. GP82]
MKKPSLKAPGLKKPSFGKSAKPGPSGAEPAVEQPATGRPSSGGGPRTGISLLAAAAVLAAAFGIAELRPPLAPAATGGGGSSTTAQVERTSLVCPQPFQGVTGSTDLTMFTPAGGSAGSASGGSATVTDVGSQSGTPSAAPSGDPSASPSAAASGAPGGARLSLGKVGVPVTGNAATGDTPPGTTAVAGGAYAPGFTVSQTTTVTDSRTAGLSGIGCAPAGTGFWFAGASTLSSRTDYVNLVNADSTPAVVDLKFYGDKGPIEVDAATGLTVAANSTQSLRVASLVKDQVKDLAVQVVARSGRVAAALHTIDEAKGADYVPASADPAATQVLPGLPADAPSAHLVVVAPGDDDADLKIQISGKNGWFTPAGHETIHIKAGMVNIADLNQITRGEVGALRLSPSDPAHPTPVVAALRIDRTQNGKSDYAWISGSNPVGKRASIADNRAGASTVYLTSTGDAATVRLTSSAGSAGGTPVTKEVQIAAGATVGLPAPEPGGLNGVFGLTVETVSGGPVVAARMLAVNTKDIPMFTIQALSDDHSTVQVPHADQDPAVLIHP